MKIYEYIVIIIYILLLLPILLVLQGRLELSIDQILLIGLMGLIFTPLIGKYFELRTSSNILFNFYSTLLYDMNDYELKFKTF